MPGGALYLQEIAILTNTKPKTASSHFKKIEESNLKLINIYYNSDNRKIITLTRRAWLQLNKDKDRDECMCKDKDLQTNLYKAFDYIQKHYF